MNYDDDLDGLFSFYFSEKSLEFRKNNQEFYHHTYAYVKINGEYKLYTDSVKHQKELGINRKDYVFVGRARLNDIILKNRLV